MSKQKGHVVTKAVGRTRLSTDKQMKTFKRVLDNLRTLDTLAENL